jgi:Immunoglobulin domain
MGSRILVTASFWTSIAFLMVGCGGGLVSSPSPEIKAPVIMTHPSSQTVAAGQSATFSAAAIGSDPLTYQWQKDGTAIAGATLQAYTTPPVTPTDSGTKFQVLISNSAGSVTSNPATLTVDSASTAPSITQQPASQAVTAGVIATFTVVAAGTAPLAYQWQKSGTAIAGATAASYTTPATLLTDNGAQFTVVVSNAAGTLTSGAATLTVTGASASPNDVVTYHNDIARTGQNLNEAILTTANVNSATFGKINSLTVDGKVDAQPLYLSGLQNIGGGTHNVLYAATEHGSVYGFIAGRG